MPLLESWVRILRTTQLLDPVCYFVRLFKRFMI